MRLRDRVAGAPGERLASRSSTGLSFGTEGPCGGAMDVNNLGSTHGCSSLGVEVSQQLRRCAMQRRDGEREREREIDR